RARAGNPQPSPFAGRYDLGDGMCRITISSSGRIKDSGGAISGRISGDGVMTLTVPFSIGWGVPPGRGGGGKATITYEGVAALDDDGNLYGVLAYVNPYGVTFSYSVFWVRCD